MNISYMYIYSESIFIMFVSEGSYVTYFYKI